MYRIKERKIQDEPPYHRFAERSKGLEPKKNVECQVDLHTTSTYSVLRRYVSNKMVSLIPDQTLSLYSLLVITNIALGYCTSMQSTKPSNKSRHFKSSTLPARALIIILKLFAVPFHAHREKSQSRFVDVH